MINLNTNAYPGFGTAVGNYDQMELSDLIKKTSAVALLFLVSIAIGAVSGGVFGIAIAAACTATILVTSVVVDRIWSAWVSHRFQSTLPIEKQTDQKDSLLGVYSTARVKVLSNTQESFQWKKQLISAAETSIELSPNFAGGKDFQEVLDLMEVQLEVKPKLRIHVLLSRDLLEKADISRLKKLAGAFQDRFVYLITDRIYSTLPFFHSEENHVKMLIIDGKYFVMGGTGIHPKMGRETIPPELKNEKGTFAAQFIDQTFRDTDLMGEGPIALTMRRQFFLLFQKWENRMKNRNLNRFFSLEEAQQGTCDAFNRESDVHRGVKIKFIVGGPEHRKDNPITKKIAKRVMRAKKEIRFTNLCFNPDDAIKQVLSIKKAQEREVEIVGYCTGTGKNSSMLHYVYAWPNRFNYGLLTKVYEHNVPWQAYHKKVITFDGKYTILGSNNLGKKSSHCDDEIVVEIKDERVAKDINQALDEDAKHSKLLTGSQLRQLNSKVPGALTILFLGSTWG